MFFWLYINTTAEYVWCGTDHFSADFDLWHSIQDHLLLIFRPKIFPMTSRLYVVMRRFHLGILRITLPTVRLLTWVRIMDGDTSIMYFNKKQHKLCFNLNNTLTRFDSSNIKKFISNILSFGRVFRAFPRLFISDFFH